MTGDDERALRMTMDPPTSRARSAARRVFWIASYLFIGILVGAVVARYPPERDAFELGLIVIIWPIPAAIVAIYLAIFLLGALARAL
jgi:hypothetical protein